MGNMLTYVRTSLDTFAVKPFNEVDALILAWFSYLNPPKWLFRDKQEHVRKVKMAELLLAEYFDDMAFGVKSRDETIELLLYMCASPRFRDMKIMYYEDLLDHSASMQFAAMTFEVMPGLYYLSYRGTDDTITGWKEDFDLALLEPVPSQAYAGEYLVKIAEKVSGRLMTGGHSKGGNLAVFAAAAAPAEIRGRVERIFSFDGPGFLDEDFKQAAFDEIRGRITKTIPESSMIGMIFKQECEFRIVRSVARGISQHNPFSWVIEDGDFSYAESLNKDSEVVYKSMNTWIAGLEPDERKRFIDDLFSILEETGVNSFDELGEGIRGNIPIMAKKYISMDKEKKDFLKGTLMNLADISAKTISEMKNERKREKRQKNRDEEEKS